MGHSCAHDRGRMGVLQLPMDSGRNHHTFIKQGSLSVLADQEQVVMWGSIGNNTHLEPNLTVRFTILF